MGPASKSPVRATARTEAVLLAITLGFAGATALLIGDLWGHPPRRQTIPLVASAFLEPTPWRRTYADLVKAKEDLSDYDCYACHERNKPPPLRFDEAGKIVVPREHSDVVMGHGSHDRNNVCYNCHNEQDLVTLQVRDGRVVKFDQIPLLCGSCHGPTYRDWEAGAHGRTSGYWDRSRGAVERLSCANCHNPHAPKIPTRQPAPPPHPLRAPLDAPAVAASH
jgi:formate-dependent nitrite reductase cytochrome c552 subunit